MMTVVCFYWWGDRWEDDGWGVRYINALYRGVERYLSIPHDFVCFTNEELSGIDDGVVLHPFDVPSSRGVLPRLFMFSEESGLFGNQVLSLDLDVIIVGGLGDIASYDGPFCSRSKFAPGQEYKLDGDVTSFRAGEMNCERFWTPVVKNPGMIERMTGGRERYWFRHVLGERGGDRWDKLFPGQLVSYKRHVRSRGNVPPPGARIVSCHGTPRPHQILHLAWVKENWNG